MRPAWTLAACWSAGAAAQVLTTLRLTEDATQDFMTRAWGYFFFPLRYDSFADALWLPLRLFDFVAFLVGYLEVDSPWEGLFTGTYFALALLGMFHLARERRPAVAVLFVPLAVAVLASVARVLPLTGRLMIYAGPTLFVSILAGVAAARFLAAPRLRRVVVAGGVTLGVLPALLLPVLVPVLSRREDAGTVLREVRDRWREGDVAYVYEGAFQAMRFYGEPLGLRPWIVGGHEGPDARSHLREVDALRGRDRAWLFYTHGSRCEIEVIRSYLETIGTEVAAVEDPGGNTGMHRTEARLYDLSDPARLTRSGAERHPVLERGDPRCRARQNSVGSAIKRRLWELLRRASGSPAR